jgi:hypothetical protein
LVLLTLRSGIDLAWLAFGPSSRRKNLASLRVLYLDACRPQGALVPAGWGSEGHYERFEIWRFQSLEPRKLTRVSKSLERRKRAMASPYIGSRGRGQVRRVCFVSASSYGSFVNPYPFRIMGLTIHFWARRRGDHGSPHQTSIDWSWRQCCHKAGVACPCLSFLVGGRIVGA